MFAVSTRSRGPASPSGVARPAERPRRDHRDQHQRHHRGDQRRRRAGAAARRHDDRRRAPPATNGVNATSGTSGNPRSSPSRRTTAHPRHAAASSQATSTRIIDMSVPTGLDTSAYAGRRLAKLRAADDGHRRPPPAPAPDAPRSTATRGCSPGCSRRRSPPRAARRCAAPSCGCARAAAARARRRARRRGRDRRAGGRDPRRRPARRHPRLLDGAAPGQPRRDARARAPPPRLPARRRAAAARVDRRGGRAPRRPLVEGRGPRARRPAARPHVHRPPDRGDPLVGHAARRRRQRADRASSTTTGSAPPPGARIVDRIRESLALWWQTAEVRRERPQVDDEVRRNLHYFDRVLFDAVPELVREIERCFGPRPLDFAPLRFSSWAGGDMDGHPGVTAATFTATSTCTAAWPCGCCASASSGSRRATRRARPRWAPAAPRSRRACAATAR